MVREQAIQRGRVGAEESLGGRVHLKNATVDREQQRRALHVRRQELEGIWDQSTVTVGGGGPGGPANRVENGSAQATAMYVRYRQAQASGRSAVWALYLKGGAQFVHMAGRYSAIQVAPPSTLR
jgi:hypothetical protein